jgi:hypothetical protein
MLHHLLVITVHPKWFMRLDPPYITVPRLFITDQHLRPILDMMKVAIGIMTMMIGVVTAMIMDGVKRNLKK